MSPMLHNVSAILVTHHHFPYVRVEDFNAENAEDRGGRRVEENVIGDVVLG
jgi:hypothetical protein